MSEPRDRRARRRGDRAGARAGASDRPRAPAGSDDHRSARAGTDDHRSARAGTDDRRGARAGAGDHRGARAGAAGPVVELAITALAAGGDGVGRDAAGRVTFVPRTVPGDRIRARLVHATASFARAELVELIEPGPARVAPPCPAFERGCGGCQWQHVAAAEQRAAKQAIVAGALRKLAGLRLHPIEAPAPPLGWRRRARFHVAGGRAGLYRAGSHEVLPLAGCPQLEPALDRAYAEVVAAGPPDGELALVVAAGGAVAVATERPWPGAPALVGRAGITGVLAGAASHGEPVVELEPGLWLDPWAFAQAGADGNAALIARVLAALPAPAGRLLELYAGAGNFTRALVAAGWTVLASDLVAPRRAPAGWQLELGAAAAVLARARGPFDALLLDPPRTGAADAIDGIARLAPPVVVYVSCDPATLARDAARLAAAGYRAGDAWPIDVMPQTAQIEVVLRLARAADPA